MKLRYKMHISEGGNIREFLALQAVQDEIRLETFTMRINL